MGYWTDEITTWGNYYNHDQVAKRRREEARRKRKQEAARAKKEEQKAKNIAQREADYAEKQRIQEHSMVFYGAQEYAEEGDVGQRSWGYSTANQNCYSADEQQNTIKNLPKGLDRGYHDTLIGTMTPFGPVGLSGTINKQEKLPKPGEVQLGPKPRETYLIQGERSVAGPKVKLNRPF